jgi:hypothetical protein
MAGSEGMTVIARRISDEAISSKNTDCFAEFILSILRLRSATLRMSGCEGLAMTRRLNFTPLPKGRGNLKPNVLVYLLPHILI